MVLPPASPCGFLTMNWAQLSWHCATWPQFSHGETARGKEGGKDEDGDTERQVGGCVRRGEGSRAGRLLGLRGKGKVK